MSEMKIFRDNKGDINKIYLLDVSLFYTNVQNPRPVFDDRKLSYKDARKEYSVVAAVPEDVADEWDEIFNKQPSTKLTNAKFLERYKMDEGAELPIPDAKKQFTVKVTQRELNKDGEPLTGKSRPRVMIAQTITQGKDTKKVLKDVTFTTLVGNGSVGTVVVRVAKNDYGTFAYLEKVIVSDLVEYEGGNDGLSAEEAELLGIDEIEYADEPEAKPKSDSKESSKDSSDEDEGDDDLPPFDPDSEEF